jgi:uncharacterized membrane protein YkgB
MISPIAIYGSLPDVFGEPLVCVPGVFLQHCFYLLDTLGPLLMKDLVVMAAGKHMGAYVQAEAGGYGKANRYEEYE